MSTTKVFSFFSYKGGAGRSTLAYNIIPLLASEHLKPTKEHPIIIVDTDLDSCGMSYLLGFDPKSSINRECCTQSLLKHGITTGSNTSKWPLNIWEHPDFKDLFKVGDKFGYDKESILFLAAKDRANVDGNNNYNDANNPFAASLSSFVKACNHYGVPAVIFDAAVGNNASANATNFVADTIVCCMRPTNQFVNGTLNFLEEIEENGTYGPTNVVLIPNVIPENASIDGREDFKENTRKLLVERFGQISDMSEILEYRFDFLEKDNFGIPAVKSFMWREGQIATQLQRYPNIPLKEDEKLALESYKKLAALLCDE